MEELKVKLSEFGNIEVIKEGIVFTLLLTGNGLSKSGVVTKIQTLVLEAVADRFPIIEAMKNTNNFFLLILKK
jgi:predicted YcjX-like family ATPase